MTQEDLSDSRLAARIRLLRDLAVQHASALRAGEIGEQDEREVLALERAAELDEFFARELTSALGGTPGGVAIRLEYLKATDFAMRPAVERLAETFHEAWRDWARKLLAEEPGLSRERRAALEDLVRLRYAELHEVGKEKARAWARRALGAPPTREAHA